MKKDEDLLRIDKAEAYDSEVSVYELLEGDNHYLLLTPETLLKLENYKYLDDVIIENLIHEYKTTRTIPSA